MDQLISNIESKIVETPLNQKNHQNLNITLNTPNKPHRNIYKKNKIINSQDQPKYPITKNVTQSIQEGQQFFEQEQLIKKKQNIQKYDCFDESITPIQWIELCKQMQGPHAMCPIYTNGSYQWHSVYVLDYNKNIDKFTIKSVNGIVKQVNRLSVMFNKEDQKIFKERLSVAQAIHSKGSEELRFFRYVDSVSNDLIREISDLLVNKILKRAHIKIEDTIEESISSDFLKNNNKNEKQQKYKKMVASLLKQLKCEYIIYQKKHYVLSLMQNPINTHIFQAQRIRLRGYDKTYIRPVILSYIYPFQEVFDKIGKLSLISKDKINKATNLLTTKFHQFLNFQMFNFHIQQDTFPLSLQEFDLIQINFHNNQCKILETQLSESLITQIQDKLKQNIIYFQIHQDLYLKSDLRKFSKFMDYLFLTFIRENLIVNTINQYCNFLQKFTVPYGPSEIWTINNYSLLILTLKINVKKNKKEDTKRNSIKFQKSQLNNQMFDLIQQEYKEETQFKPVTIEPSFYEIKIHFLYLFKILLKSINNICSLEGKLLPLLFPDTLIQKIDENDPFIKQGQDLILKFLETGFTEVQIIIEEFDKYRSIVEQNQSKILNILFGEKDKSPSILQINADEINKKLEELSVAKQNIQRISIDKKKGCMFEIRTKQAKDDLIQRVNDFMLVILNRISILCFDNSLRIQDIYKKLEKQLQIVPKNEDELLEIQTAVNDNTQNLINLRNQVSSIEFLIKIMESYQFELPQDKMQIYWELYSSPQNIQRYLFNAKKSSLLQEEKLCINLEIEKEQFAKQLKILLKEFINLKQFQLDIDNQKQLRENATFVLSFSDQVEKAYSTLKSFNYREAALKLPVSHYEDLQILMRDLHPYKQMWSISMDFELDKNEWTNNPLLKIVFSTIDKKVQYYLKEILKLKKFFDDKFEIVASDVTSQMKNSISLFKETLWVFELLTTEAVNNIRKSNMNWKDLIKEATNRGIDFNSNMTFHQLIEQNILDNKSLIQDISKKAEMQWGIIKQLKDVEEKIKLVEIIAIPYKKANTYLLKGEEEISLLLDNSLNIITMVKGSPYIKPLLKSANILENKLILIQDTLEEIMKYQRNWKYLEPIFTSDDIKVKLPKEQQAFQKIDQYWHQIIEFFQLEPLIWDCIDSDKLKLELIAYNKNFEMIQRSLSLYLESKRKYFPRLYFLGDDELIEILADSKDPLKVQKHINKCFEAISQLYFDDNQQVIGMVSSEQEIVLFKTPIDVNKGEKKGNVEIWMSEIHQMMVETLQYKTKLSIEDTKQQRIKWIQAHPGQIILSVNMFKWTSQTEKSIINSCKENYKKVKNQFQNLPDFLCFLEEELDDIVDFIRQDLTDLVRLTLEGLVVIDVHGKNIIVKLIQSQISDIQNFEWQCQMRYYWEETKKDEKMWVKMINSEIKYGFEYLGNSPRLVITPLTDRCYRTLMGAKHLQYGGAPEGPAGTGKTETVKDLAKALAYQCIVFNCSDGLNYLSMRKFFKGLASSGAWCCFDEFNRINLEVLSVIAQQILTIQTAIKEKRRQFIFDDDEISLIHSFAVNITMNPGYAGRSELPENLKALFRPVAMMLPDYALISEIYLYSVGFNDAKNLARKIVDSLRLSSEQLSSQDHYDSGLRAVKAIITSAGKLKRQMSQENEDIICLRALMDASLPKFTIADTPLFLSITNDLFPNVQHNYNFNQSLRQSLIDVCIEKKIEPYENFLLKCQQLENTIHVRHGIMMIGQAGSGKTTVLQTVRKAKSKTNETKLFQINPKSITNDQLYGTLDQDTKVWNDGIAAIIMRMCAGDGVNNQEKKWILFDGPVDAVWIENMNTVLDDNKKLCLTSGEIIKITNQMIILFEVEDLQYASPATVSRCGMVYMDVKSLCWRILISGFISDLHERMKPYIKLIHITLEWLISSSLAWALNNGKFVVHQMENNFVISCLNIFKIIVNEILQMSEFPKDYNEHIKQMILYSVAWSIGGGIDENSRKQYSLFLQHTIQGNPISPELLKFLDFEYLPQTIYHTMPENFNIFEYIYNQKMNQWVNWILTQPRYIVPKGGEYNTLLIPTVDSIRNDYFLNIFIQNNINFLLCGPSGTGKSVNIINQINKNFYNQDYTNLCTSFSSQTKANQFQKIIESKVSTRRRKGCYGPEEGKKFIVIFVDDLNMPVKETFGAQPSIELLRQCLVQGGVYDLDTKEFKFLQNIIFVAAMLPSGNQISQRCLRHFQLLYVEPFENQSLTRIFTHILDWYFQNLEEIPAGNIINLQPQIIKSTIDIYKKIQNSKDLLPIPAKSHYIYNMRDLSKVFQGISKSSVYSYKTPNDFLKLWINECERVFKDRLINEYDQEIFHKILKKIFQKNFQKDLNLLITVQPLIFAQFIPFISQDGGLPLENIYCEISDHELLKKKCDEYLENYNIRFSSNRMNLVLFTSAIGHIIRIVRILTTLSGHCLLVGVGGSGRKSLASLSTFIIFNNQPQQIDPKQWEEDLKKVMVTSVSEEKETVLMVSDNQLIKESNTEDICYILNKGEVPQLFTQEEKSQILENIDIDGSPNEKYLYLVNQWKKYFHLVITFSPVGDAFRKRLRAYPAFINCTSIDWFLPWPIEAFENTASNFLTNEILINDATLNNNLVKILVEMHNNVTQLTKRYLEELRKFFYVTPSSFLELLSNFKNFLQKSGKENSKQTKRYDTGVKKILEIQIVIEKMQKDLEEFQPKLILKTQENQQMLVQLLAEQNKADIQKEFCQKEEIICNIQRDQANSLKEECQKELNRVIPLLDAAAQALENIQKDDMNTLKSFVNPPQSAAITMEGLCYVFDEDKYVSWIPKPEGKLGEKMQDFWNYSKKKLLNDKLIKRVKEFKEERIKNIPEKNIEKLKIFVNNPLLDTDKVFNASQAAGNLSLWIRSVVDTYTALQLVDPKRKLLEQAQMKLQLTESDLEQKKMELKKVIDLLQNLKNDYLNAKKEQEELQARVNKCKIQLGILLFKISKERADKLISGLGGEKDLWQIKANQYRAELVTCIGDQLISSGIITYLGAFPLLYREETISHWKKLLNQSSIQFSQNYSLQNILCDKITIGKWVNNYKLPNDTFSIDNAIILMNSVRWPLMIDPQNQANAWIRKLNQSRNIKIIRPHSASQDIIFQLEQCISLGYPVLLEHISEEIDQLYEPILQKKLIPYQGGNKIKFRDKLLNYSADFYFYLTTKLSRPHYPPEICIQVTLLNFQITVQGLEDQITNIVVQIEEPIKERQRQMNIEDFFANKQKLLRTEDLILKLLNESQGSLLDDEELIETMRTSKKETIEIDEALLQQENFSVIFEGIRKNYTILSQRVANIYFVILDLASIESSYQWSLDYYIGILVNAVEQTNKSKEQRVNNIINQFQAFLFDNICRSLFEKDKLIFCLLMCQKILEIKQIINITHIRFLMMGGTITETSLEMPQEFGLWFTKKHWCSLNEMEQSLPIMNGFVQDFVESIHEWGMISQQDDCFRIPFPGRWNELHYYFKLIIIRILFPDKFQNAIMYLIEQELGKQYTETPSFDLTLSIKDASPSIPLIFLLSPGAEPRLEILNIAEKANMKSSLMQISLGQGQGMMAERSIKQCLDEGRWVLLQNCHLAPSFMPQLEKIIEVIDNTKKDINSNFRLWLTSSPSEIFPSSILMKGIKITYEPPKGLKNNLFRSFQNQDKKQFEECLNPHAWKKLFFGLAFFHSLILERRRYGPLGWNIPYEFTDADFIISYSQLKIFLNQQENIPFEALNYMIAENNYGGRVTDPKDRRLLAIILKDFFNNEILQDNYRFSSSPVYYSPVSGDLSSYFTYIESLPNQEIIEIFGLHSNAEISSAIMDTNNICDKILLTLPRTISVQGRSPEETIKEKCKEMTAKLPKNFNMDQVGFLYPVIYEESMNIVLRQELIRYNKLLEIIKNSLITLENAIEGLIVMTQELEKIFFSIFDNKIPEMWQKHSYPSLKPLGSYLIDFLERLNFMQIWIDKGIPKSFWISGFFFTQSFLTGTLQNYARKQKIPIDQLQFQFNVTKEIVSNSDGCYIYGLFLDGASWDFEQNCITYSIHKQLHCKMPLIQLKPTIIENYDDNSQKQKSGVYECPCYKTMSRRGILSMTGHSTNFIFDLMLSTLPGISSDIWVKMGVAAVTQLND